MLLQITAEALDSRAGFFKRACRRGVGDAERRTDAERRPLHHRDAFRLQKFS